MFRTILICAIIAMSVASWFMIERVEAPILTVERDRPILIQSNELRVIDQVNQHNSSIKSFSAERINIQVWRSGHRLKLHGKMFYEKPNNFRLLISSPLGKESDIGSDEQQFWYWSKRDRKPGLYWAIYEDYGKTRLKTPFNPVFMRSSLGFEALDPDPLRCNESGDTVYLVYPRISSTGGHICYVALIGKSKNDVQGFIITNLDGKLLVACEIKKRVGDVPSQILYRWYEEDIVMLIDFIDPKINQPMQKNAFQVPNYSPKINMGEE